MEHSVIRTHGLCYSYSKGSTTLLDINLDVAQGSIYGFLGPNGSGKTTTLSLLLGLLKSQQGGIEIFGKEFNAHRIDILKKTGSLIESPSLYGHLTARENLEVYRPVYGVAKSRVDEVLRITGLTDTGKKVLRRFSLGMKQRLALALALLPKPALLILDEPTNGLDPAGIIELREIMKRLNKEEGITILISSHILAEVEKMVSHVGIISRGRMLFQGPMHDLHQLQQDRSKLLIHTSDNEAATWILQRYKPEIVEGNVVVPFGDTPQIADINRALTSSGLDVYLLHPRKNDLEQLFIDLTANQS